MAQVTTERRVATPERKAAYGGFAPDVFGVRIRHDDGCSHTGSEVCQHLKGLGEAGERRKRDRGDGDLTEHCRRESIDELRTDLAGRLEAALAEAEPPTTEERLRRDDDRDSMERVPAALERMAMALEGVYRLTMQRARNDQRRLELQEESNALAKSRDEFTRRLAESTIAAADRIEGRAPNERGADPAQDDGAIATFPRETAKNFVLSHPRGTTVRKTTRSIAIRMQEPFRVETEHGWIGGEAGDYMVTNHPDDDASSDAWPVSRDRFERTYEQMAQVTLP